MARKKTKPAGSLAKGRPPVFSTQPQRTMSRKVGRKLINTHHTLEKQRKQAVARGDSAQEREIAAQIAALGGLEKYQQASLQGQRRDRGGDTSKVILEWLAPELSANARARQSGSGGGGGGGDRVKPRMLEVGALSTQNACTASGLFDMELIDLNSREPGILQQDFMQRPLPPADAEKPGLPQEGQADRGHWDDGQFDVISLSLVLNFVPDARGRGEMLRRTLQFLRPGGVSPARRSSDDDEGRLGEPQAGEAADAQADPPFPCLFVVLPRPCISNSRYFTDERFRELMGLLGYEQVRSKLTEKLVYYLWRRRAPLLEGGGDGVHRSFGKKEINPGRTRNNFAIVLEESPPPSSLPQPSPPPLQPPRQQAKQRPTMSP